MKNDALSGCGKAAAIYGKIVERNVLKITCGKLC